MCDPSQQFKLLKLFFKKKKNKKTSALVCPVQPWGGIGITGELTTILGTVVADGLVLETWAEGFSIVRQLRHIGKSIVA